MIENISGEGNQSDAAGQQTTIIFAVYLHLMLALQDYCILDTTRYIRRRLYI